MIQSVIPAFNNDTNRLCVPVLGLPCKYALINKLIPNSTIKIICGVPIVSRFLRP